MKVWVEVSEDRLASNLRAIATAAGSDTEILAVVKANAYGHGAERCAATLARAGATWLGVTCADEGHRIRSALNTAGLTSPAILVMCGFLPEDVPTLQQSRLTPVIWTSDHIRWLTGTGLKVHIEVDTGMGRQGVRPGANLDRLLGELAAVQLRLDGIFTHFCSSEVAASDLTQTQERRFETAVAQSLPLKPSWIHAGNSSTVDNPAQPWPWLAQLAHSAGARAMVRTGLALYGYCLPIEPPSPAHVRPSLQPVLTWKARVLAVHDLNPGDTVGYGAAFTAPAPMRVALLPVGYADGLRRELSSTTDRPGGWTVIHGARAPILGRISMNLTVVDVTAIANVLPGDEAILLADGITAEDHARLADTIPYEILCALRER